MRFDIVTRNLITQNTDLSNLINGVFPLVVPPNISAQDKPVVVYTQVSNADVTTKTSYNDYGRAVMQLSIFCKSYDKARIVAEWIKWLFDRYSGTVTVDRYDHKVDLIRFQNQVDLGFDEDNNVFMIAQDYLIAMVENQEHYLKVDTDKMDRMDTNQAGEVIY